MKELLITDLMDITALFFGFTIMMIYSFVFVGALATPNIARFKIYKRKMDRYQALGFNPYRVPPAIRDLIPLAKKWGLANKEDRRKLQIEASADEKKKLGSLIAGKEEIIIKWLSLFNNGQLTKEAKAFSWMLANIEEMGLLLDPSDRLDQETVELNPIITRSISPYNHNLKTLTAREKYLIIPSWSTRLMLLPLAFVHFILLGKIWAFFFAEDPDSIGLAVVLFSSGLLSYIVLGLTMRTIEIMTKGKVKFEL